MNKKSFVKYGIILVVVYLVIITFIHFGQKSVDKEAGIKRAYCIPICPICFSVGNK